MAGFRRSIGLACVAVAALAAASVRAEDVVGSFDITLTAPRRTPIPRDIDSQRFPVQAIAIDGADGLDDGTRARLTTPLTGHDVSLSDLLGVAEAIEAYYKDKGFALAHAFVPHQTVRDGVVHVTVAEGSIRDIVIEGVEGQAKEHLATMFEPLRHERPLRTGTLERVLLLANDLPGLTVSGLLRPADDNSGAADLVVTATRKSVAGWAGVDNATSRYLGPWGVNGDVVLNSLFGQSEQIILGVSASPQPEKVQGLHGRYIQPVGTDGLFLTTVAQYERDAEGYSLKSDNVLTHTVSAGERAAYPLVRSRAQNLILDGGLTWKSTTEDMLGAPYYTDHWRVGDVKLSWTQSGWLGTATAMSLDLAQGVPFLGGNARGDSGLSRATANPGFTKLAGDISAKKILAPGWQVYFAASGQYAFSTLLEGEEFTLGGAQFGRGYDPSTEVGDLGVGGTLELQYETRDALPIDARLAPFWFIDGGKVWDRSTTGNNPFLDSTGVGLRLKTDGDTTIAATIAHPLHGRDSTVPNDPVRPYLSVTTRF